MPRLRYSGVIVIAGALLWLAVIWSRQDQPMIGADTFPPSSASPVISGIPAADELLESLQASISSLLKRVEELETAGSYQPPASPVPSTPPLANGGTKPGFQTQTVYLGSGMTTEREWTETGAQVWINSADYPSGIKAVFEAGLSIIGGEVWARLKNKTTGAIISVSEIFHNTSIVSWKSAPAFKLHPGNNLYVVELKSSSNEAANLAGSRIQLSQ